MGKPLANRKSSTVKRGGIAEEHVREVGTQHQGVEFVCQLRDVLSGVDLAQGLRLPYDFGQGLEDPRVHVAQVVPNRPCFRVEFGSRGHEKTPPGKDGALEIRQKGLTDGEDTARTRGCGPSRLPHFTLEHFGRGINRRDLEVFLRSKVREEAALAHADVVSQARYRQTIESLDRRQFSGGVQDRLTAPGAVRPSAPSIRFGISRPSP